MNDRIAFIEHNFAPPSLRRAIGILGFLHKRSLGCCHPALQAVLPLRVGQANAFHSRQLEPFFDRVSGYRALYDNSIYMYVLVYNRLPQVLVDCETVSSFQSKLTHIAKVRAQQDHTDSWRGAFQSCADVVNYFYG